MSTAPIITTPSNPSRSQRFYRPELDCLRFFAFSCVFVSHVFPLDADSYTARHIPFGTLFAGASRAGSFGVDLFFLLSAYLITELLLTEKEQFGEIHLKSFYIRRILRIWPLYFLAILIGAFLPLLDATQRFPLSYVAAFLLLSGNWLTSLVGFPGSVMNPLWSVSFEEQFYLIWPILVSSARLAKTLLLYSGLLIVIAQIARLILLRYTRPSDVAIFTNTLARLDPLALGVVTAALLHRKRVQLDWFLRLSSFTLGAVVWLIAGHYFGRTRAFMLIGYPGMALGSWLIFMSVLGIGVAPRWLRYLGKISYGLYVFHLLAIYLAEKLISAHGKHWGKFVVYYWLSLAMTIVMASVSYHFLEAPFLRLKERFSFVRSRPV